MREIEKIILFFVLICLGLLGYTQNPIVPPGVYIADPEAHVWSDGRAYLYGSRDESHDYWCSHRYHVLFSSDLLHWDRVENLFASIGENDQVDYCDYLLFAPDCAYKDGRYYLFYCMPDREKFTEGVAVSSSPLGPFVNGKNIEGAYQIDPAILIDDDGQAYYFWGQGKPKVAKISPSLDFIDKRTITFPLDSAGNVAFHEGSSIRKIGKFYYLVFADDSRRGRPTCLGYAISKNPMGPYQYKGIIIDNFGCDPEVWNNHGSIEKFRGQWYVFYHRSSNHSQKFRKACIEPITIKHDGTIDEVEMTSQGAGRPLDARSLMPAERACYLSGQLYIRPVSNADVPNEELANIAPNDWAAFKYLRFRGESRFRMKTSGRGGVVELHIDAPDGPMLGRCDILADLPNSSYSISSCKVKHIRGVHALYLVFKQLNGGPVKVDWFQFSE